MVSIKHVIAPDIYASIVAGLNRATIGCNPTNMIPIKPVIKPFFIFLSKVIKNMQHQIITFLIYRNLKIGFSILFSIL